MAICLAMLSIFQIVSYFFLLLLLLLLLLQLASFELHKSLEWLIIWEMHAKLSMALEAIFTCS